MPIGQLWNLASCFALFALFALLCGCASRQDLLNFSSKIPVEITADPHNPLHELRTFAVIPLAEAAREAAKKSSEQPQPGEITDPLTEKLFLQGAAQSLIARGYQHVEPDQSPDFVVFIQVSNRHQEVYVPPSQITVPIYLPGTTTNVYSSVTGYGNWFGSGSVWSGSSYGGYSGSGDGTV